MTNVTIQVLEGVDQGRIFRNLPTPLTIGREEGNLLRLEIAEPGLGIEYHAQVVKPTDPLYAEHLAIASNPVPNSDKRWGFR